MPPVIASVVLVGYLSAYALNPTVGTLAYRQQHGQIPQGLSAYEVFVAVPNCDLIGREGLLTVIDEETGEHRAYRALVYDCAGKGGHEWMLSNGIAAEVDYWFWKDNPELVGTNTEVVLEFGE